MATDFNNKAVLGKPSFVGNKNLNDLPLDARIRIDTLDEVSMITFPYVGMLFYIRDEEKFYVVKSLKGEEQVPGIAATFIPNYKIDVFEEFSGGGGEGMTEEEKAILIRLNETVGYEGVDSEPEYYLASDQYTPGALKVVSDNAVPLAGEVRLSDANINGGAFNVGDYVLLVEATEPYDGEGLAEQVRKNTKNIGESGEVAKPLHYELVQKSYDEEVLQVVSDATDPLPAGCILKKDANANASQDVQFKVGDRIRLMPEIPEVPEAYRLATSTLEPGVTIVADNSPTVSADQVKLATANMNGGNFTVGEIVVYRAAQAATKDVFVSCVLTSKDALIVVDSNKDPIEANEVKLSEVVSINGQVEGAESFVVGSCVKFIAAKDPVPAHFEYPNAIWENGAKEIIAADSEFIEADQIKMSEVEPITAGFNVGDRVVYVPYKAAISEYYVQDVGSYPEGAKLVVDNNKAIVEADEIKLSDANMNGGNFAMGDYVVLKQASEQVEGSGILWRLDLLEARNYDEIIGREPVEGVEEVKDVYTLAEPDYPAGTLSVVANGTDPLEEGCVHQDTANLNQANPAAIPVGAKVIHIAEVIASEATYAECKPNEKGALTVVADSTENPLDNQIKQADIQAVGCNFDIGQIVKFVPAVEGVVEHYEVVNKNVYGPDALEIVIDGSVTKANQVELSAVYASGSTDPNGDPFDVGDMVTVVKGNPAVIEDKGSGILGRLAALEKLHEGELEEPEEEPEFKIVETIVNEDFPPGGLYEQGQHSIPVGDLLIVDIPAELQYRETSTISNKCRTEVTENDEGYITQFRVYLENERHESIKAVCTMVTLEGEEVVLEYKWSFKSYVYFGACDVNIDELTADIIMAGEKEALENFNEITKVLKLENQYDFFVYPIDFGMNLKSINQNGFNILDSYDSTFLDVDDVYSFVYCSKWKQTFPDGIEKTLIKK